MALSVSGVSPCLCPPSPSARTRTHSSGNRCKTARCLRRPSAFFGIGSSLRDGPLLSRPKAKIFHLLRLTNWVRREVRKLMRGYFFSVAALLSIVGTGSYAVGAQPQGESSEQGVIGLKFLHVHIDPSGKLNLEAHERRVSAATAPCAGQHDDLTLLEPRIPVQRQNATKRKCGPSEPVVAIRYGQHASLQVGDGFVLPPRRLLLVEMGDAQCLTVDPPLKDYNNLCHKALFVNVGDSQSAQEWIPIVVTRHGLSLNRDLFAQSNSSLVLRINGTPVSENMSDLTFGSRDVRTYHVEAFEKPSGCRRYPKNDKPLDAIDIEIPVLDLGGASANGIEVDPPKVFDSYTLRTKLSAAAQQLSAISPWNTSAITNAYGTLQGITRDVSYFAAQVQTAPTPSQVITNAVGSTTLSPSVTTSQSAQCPAGYYVSQVGTSGVSCTQLPQQAQQCPSGYYVSQVTTAGTAICSQLPNASSGTQLPPTSVTSTQTNSAPQSTQVQTTLPSLTPTIPTVPTSSPLSAPTNVGVSSSDMLAEQVQLNAQLQIYQMLLQGAQSDQVVLKNSHAVGQRAQTTIGFQISIDPPRQFRHAMAEVRVVIVPHPNGEDRYSANDSERLSVVTLLPSAKTYNVAKITSHQNAFGAGAVIEQVNVGVNTGKSKDRLYLAKESDTVALDYPKLTIPPLQPPFPEKVWQLGEELLKEQRLAECDETWRDDAAYINASSVMFGWQFRPVLAADYVAAGTREVFAQLALPASVNEEGFAPAVYVQTRWRQYDEKRQVVGPVFHSSCNWTRVQDPVYIVSPLRVNDVTWDDVGTGIVRVRAKGDFLSSGMTVMSGGTNITPTTFDGRTIQFFAPAHDLLQNGSIDLVGEGGQRTPLAIQSKQMNDDSGQDMCGIAAASLKVVPFPDGNSRAELKLEYGSLYSRDTDGPVQPLALIGNDVYGIQQKPFLDFGLPSSCTLTNDSQCSKPSGCNQHLTCVYHFVAQTDALRGGQTFLVRDIAWDRMSNGASIQFAPTFTSLSSLSPSPTDKSAASQTGPTGAGQTPEQPPVKPVYAITGGNLGLFALMKTTCGKDKKEAAVSESPYGLTLYVDGTSSGVGCDDLEVLSETMATLQLQQVPKGKSVKLVWHPSRDYTSVSPLPVSWDLALSAPEQGAKPAPSPSFLYRGDSQTVTFTGTDFSTVVDVKFENAVLSLPTPPSAKKLDVQIPVAVTSVPGHKELVADTVDKNGKKGTIVLSIDVLRR